MGSLTFVVSGFWVNIFSGKLNFLSFGVSGLRIIESQGAQCGMCLSKPGPGNFVHMTSDLTDFRVAC